MYASCIVHLQLVIFYFFIIIIITFLKNPKNKAFMSPKEDHRRDKARARPPPPNPYQDGANTLGRLQCPAIPTAFVNVSRGLGCYASTGEDVRVIEACQNM